MRLSRRRVLAGMAALATLGLDSVATAADRLGRFTAPAAGNAVAAHDALDDLLGRYVHGAPDGINRVDYSRWQRTSADRQALDGYITALSRTEPASLKRPDQFAFWANLYNAATLRLVLEAYPVASIREIKPHLFASGPWSKPVISVQGVELSLDDIEHGILRTGWREPRVHYAVNCASRGCPNLRARAFRGERLEPDLTDAAIEYVNHPRGARLEGDRLVVSSIYKWYREDFGTSDARLTLHLAKYAKPALRARLATVRHIERDAYDWTLNDVLRP